VVNFDTVFGRAYRHLWLVAIIGCILVSTESLLHYSNVIDAWFSIGLCVSVTICLILTRYDILGSGFAGLACSFILLLSPIGFSGFGLGVLLIVLGALISTSGGLYTYSSFFFYVAIGAVIIDLILFFMI